MPQMLSLRTFLLISLSGHTVQFKRDEPVNVPDAAVDEALAKGCVIANDEDMESAIARADKSSLKIKVDFQGNVRYSALALAVQQVVDANDTKEFDSSGAPKLSVIAERVGFSPSAKELQEVHRAVMNARSEGRQLELAPEAKNILRIVDASAKDLVDLAVEFGDKEADAKAMNARALKKSLLKKFTGITG